MMQGLELCCVVYALTLVATHWNTRIDSNPILALRCVDASDRKSLAQNTIFLVFVNSTQRIARSCVNIANR